MHFSFRRSLAVVLATFSVAALAAPSPTTTPPTEAIAFVTAAAQAGHMEMEAANRALQTSSNEAVKAFARQMVSDHGKIHADLVAVAKPKDIPVPEKPNAEQVKMLEQLRASTGAAFDAAYANQMVNDHGKAVELFQANVTTPDSELSAFAARTLPVMLEHRRQAQNLSANMKAGR